MCWSYEVSLTFVYLFIFTNICYIYARPKYWIEYLMFGTFYLVMEVFQTIQWMYGDIYNNTLQGVNHCSIINQKYTIIAHILIWLQPLLFSIIGYRTATNKIFFKYLNYINLFVLIFSMVNLCSGFYKDNYYQINNSIFGLSTCTDTGITGHLVWRFKPSSIEYFPHYLMYFIMCTLSFLMYDRRQTQIIGIGWLSTLIITKLVLWPDRLELASSWCLLSIVANVIILVYNLILKLNVIFDI